MSQNALPKREASVRLDRLPKVRYAASTKSEWRYKRSMRLRDGHSRLPLLLLFDPCRASHPATWSRSTFPGTDSVYARRLYMRFLFDKAACQNTRRALRREWLLTNGLGDYSSSTILCCNTRKYHGLLVVNTVGGRHVLLSALEDSVVGGGKEFFLCTRQHPGLLHPRGHEYLESFQLDQWPVSVYRMGDVRLLREIVLLRGKSRLLLRWSLQGQSPTPPLTLRLKPLLAFRSFHSLTQVDENLNPFSAPLENGFCIRPHQHLPPLYIQAQGHTACAMQSTGSSPQGCSFSPAPDWYRNVEYLEEHERGFAASEDLFMPGLLDIALPPLPQGGSVYMMAGTEPCEENPESLWAEEVRNRDMLHRKNGGLAGHLAETGQHFCMETHDRKPAILAGYPWFDAWGRDTLISLPGLTFHANRADFGLRVLAEVGRTVHDGLVPNMFSHSGDHAYNSVDAALWYAVAVQAWLETAPDGLAWVRENVWAALKAIVQGYRSGPGQGIHVDGEGLVHAGDAHTQLTWMDAQAGGKPVTPRHGCPVEVNALWYNTLAFADFLATSFGEEPLTGNTALRALRQAFFIRFWTGGDGGYLGDVWRGGELDQSVRPNQILAVSLPYSVLSEACQPQVVECVRNKLLTPYGLRTLAPDSPAYKGHYGGSPQSRDSAYHQGTVWPWLLGHFADALLRVAWDVEGAVRALLETLTPLYSDHLAEAGLGSVSEVFDGSPPYRPGGCISQAWSVAECLRLLLRARKAAPAVCHEWEKGIAHRLANPLPGDTAGICRAILTPADAKDTAEAAEHAVCDAP